MLGEAVNVYLDAGPTPAAAPSSIVDVTGKAPLLLRAGAISTDQLPDAGVAGTLKGGCHAAKLAGRSRPRVVITRVVPSASR
jgi:hypothetical protein